MTAKVDQRLEIGREVPTDALPCPFCGGATVIQGPSRYSPHNDWSIGCPSAFVPYGADGYRDCIGPCVVMRPSREDALALWNKRA